MTDIKSIISSYMLDSFHGASDQIRGYLSDITDYPAAVRIYREYSTENLGFEIDKHHFLLTVSLLINGHQSPTQIYIKGNTYDLYDYNRWLRLQIIPKQTKFPDFHRMPDVCFSCECNRETTCDHARALFALYGSIIYPSIAPKIFKWRNWISNLPVIDVVTKSSGLITLKMTKSNQEYSIRSTLSRSFFWGSENTDNPLLNVHRLLSEKTKIFSTQGASILGLISASKLPIELRSQNLYPGQARNIDINFHWTEKLGELTLKSKMPSKIDIIPTDPPYFIDLDKSEYGIATLKSGILNLLNHSKTLGSIPADEAREFSIALIEANLNIPLPDLNLAIVDKKVRPKIAVSFSGGTGRKPKPIVDLSFQYDEAIPKDGKTIIKTGENTYTRYQEDEDFIAAVMDTLRPIGVGLDDDDYLPEPPDTLRPSQLTQIQSELESLQRNSEGALEINVENSYPIQLQEYDGQLDIDTSLDASTNLINFTPGILIKGTRINLLKPILTLLDKLKDDEEFTSFLNRLPQNVYLDIDEKTALQLPISVVKPLLQFIHDYSASKSTIRITRFDADALFKLQENLGANIKSFYLDPRVQQSKGFFETLRNNQTVPSVSMPTDFIGHLEPYQKKGVDWLCFLSTYGFGGILADDMGAGKTRQLIGYLSVRRKLIMAGSPKPHFLIVAPLNPTQDWLKELAITCPSIDAYLLHGTGRAQTLDDIKKHELIITTYGTFVNDEFLREIEWDTAIYDEVQDGNNVQTEIHKKLSELKARTKFASSGTPMENTLEELRAVIDLVIPGYLGKQAEFNRWYTKPIIDEGSREVLQTLRRKIGPFILRRKDGDEGIDFKIPPNDSETIYFDLEGAHLDQYEKVRVAGHTEVLRKLKQSGLLKGGVNTLPSISEMRGICCDLSLAKEFNAEIPYRNPKLEYLVKELIQLSSVNKKALVFTYFEKSMTVISNELNKHNIGHVCIDGSDSKSSRDRKKDEFRENKTDHIVATLKAMNSGANLQNAHAVYVYDPWYNPHKVSQAIKRADRKGRLHDMITRRLLFKNTVEIGVTAISEKKIALFDAVLEGDINYVISGGITQADIDLIFKSPCSTV